MTFCKEHIHKYALPSFEYIITSWNLASDSKWTHVPSLTTLVLGEYMSVPVSLKLLQPHPLFMSSSSSLMILVSYFMN